MHASLYAGRRTEGGRDEAGFAVPSVKYGAGSRHRLFATDDPCALQGER